jgi:kynureninase
MPLTYSHALELDAQDELAPLRTHFAIPDSDLIYLDGNSLGRLPKPTAVRLQEVIQDEWGSGLIRGWNANWWHAPRRVGEKIARLIGADEGQVIVSDTTSINLYKLVMAALRLRPDRQRILSDSLNFPSDLYIFQGCLEASGAGNGLDLLPSRDDIAPDLEKLDQLISNNTALVSLSHVCFKSGYMYDAQAVTEMAHRKGALVLWDLSHAAGAVEVALDAWKADFAVGCTYKYLNGGPGSPAYLYVRKDLQEATRQPIWGWWGQRAPFEFGLDYTPAPGIMRYLVSSPAVLSMLAVETGVEGLLSAGIERLRAKSIKQTEFLISLFEERLADLGFTLGSPRDPSQRGSHVSLRHPEGYRINRALIEEMNVIPDFREPDNLRLGIAPIYTSYVEIWEAVDRIRRAVTERCYEHFPQTRLTVT